MCDKFKDLKIDCKNCFGLCCVALYFSKFEGFPSDKVAGKPCSHLSDDFSCKIHESLSDKGLKGCTAYDCFGAGQKVAQVTYKGIDWKQSSKTEMFDVFVVMRQLHEMLWYLTDASLQEVSISLKKEVEEMRLKIVQLTYLDLASLLVLDIESYRDEVNKILRQIGTLSGEKLGKDLMGKNLTKKNLINSDLRGALLIAANLKNQDLSGANVIAADFRDADIRGAKLDKCLFLTQSQINVAKGDQQTKIPKWLSRPAHW